MKKYVVPAMKLHKLKAGSIMEASAKPTVDDRSGSTTQSFEVDEEFDSKNFFN